MINELYELSQALEHHNLLESTTNRDVNKIGKYQCLLIELDKAGKSAAMRLLSKEEKAQLWRHSKSKHNSFPAIHIQEPLLDTTESQKAYTEISKLDYVESQKAGTELWKKAILSEKLKVLQSLDFSAINLNNTDIIIGQWSLNELSPVLKCSQPELEALKRLITRFPKDPNERTHFYKSLLDSIKTEIERCNSDAMADYFKDILAGKYDKVKKKYVSGCMTYYDIYETDEVPCKVISPDTSKELVRLLNESSKRKETKKIQHGLCALSGKQEEIIEDKFPEPNLPLLGPTYLYSKKADIPCLTRYCMSGVGAFPASKSTGNAINDALDFLTKTNRKDKTWRAIADSNQGKSNLLLAYLMDDPENDALLAKILDDPSDYTEMEPAFEALCKQVLGEIEDVREKNPQSKINLIILERLDKGRKQIVYKNTFSTEQFRNNLLTWEEASKNHPVIKIRIYDKKEIKVYRPICPGPDEICQLLKMHYTRSEDSKGKKAKKTKGVSSVSIHDIYRLYMPQKANDINDHDFLQEILCETLRKTSLMLGDISQQMTMEYILKSIKAHKIEKASIAISLIAILLWRLGVRKEEYMLDAPFNVGQFLRLADMLHKQYCVHVRNGGDEKKQLPTQLMGNEMLVIASENPIEGLNRLKERMKIYLAWADTVTGADSRLAKWILVRFSEVSAKIAAGELPESFTTAEQAQVLLGYLAAIKKEDENND